MLFDNHFKIVFDQSVSTYRENLPWILVGLVICVGTFIACFIILYIGDLLTGRSLTHAWSSFSNQHNKSMSRTWQSYTRMFFFMFACAVGLVGFTCAAVINGINIIGIVLAYGIFTVLINLMFGTLIRCLGAYITLTFSRRIEIDFWVSLPERNVEGRVVSINIMDIELEYIDEKCDAKSIRRTAVPTYYFRDFIVDRNFKREIEPGNDPCHSQLVQQSSRFGLRPATFA